MTKRAAGIESDDVQNDNGQGAPKRQAMGCRYELITPRLTALSAGDGVGRSTTQGPSKGSPVPTFRLRADHK
jgi:hypothetical protein